MKVREILALSLIGALATACGSGTTATGPATMNVHLVDAPSPGYSEINVDVQTVEIASDSGWIVLGSPNRVINLLALTGGVEQTLANGATLPAGHYGQMRLVLGSRNTVKLKDTGAVEDLTVPSGQQSGVKLVVNFDVQPGTTYDVYIDFDAYRSVFVHAAGASGKYMLRPTVRAFERLETGSISGTLTFAGAIGPSGPTGPTGPIAGAVVTAQTVTAGGDPVVARSTVTDASGRYTLDLLPRDVTYFVVSQPNLYDPQASGPITITAANPVQTWNGVFTLAPATGAVAGVVIPVATTNQSDIVDVRYTIGTQPFIVRTVTADVTSNGTSSVESYTVPDLPTQAGGRLYTMVATRRTDNSGTYSYATSIAPTTTVMPNATTTVNFSFP